MERVINKLKYTLISNEDVDKESVQVYFDTIGLDSMNIVIYMYTDILDYTKYLEFRQKINEQILKVLEDEKIKMAYPGQNVYVHQA